MGKKLSVIPNSEDYKKDKSEHTKQLELYLKAYKEINKKNKDDEMTKK